MPRVGALQATIADLKLRIGDDTNYNPMQIRIYQMPDMEASQRSVNLSEKSTRRKSSAKKKKARTRLGALLNRTFDSPLKTGKRSMHSSIDQRDRKVGISNLASRANARVNTMETETSLITS